jgi:hypothetical protein
MPITRVGHLAFLHSSIYEKKNNQVFQHIPLTGEHYSFAVTRDGT